MSEDEEAWTFYKEGTDSIEIQKDGLLQKIHFRCKDRILLRTDMKEKFNYEVDRSSPSNKLRDLVAWSWDIMDEITYARRIHSNRFTLFFVKYR
ncbi:hypothetical protein NP493_1263g00002 [Ridgeia piscesae]|uniref:Uncharacterized protein n=1 Tax=Ridgeia piscesae TaxID=27915 RepID=A0AAD9KBR6_RIDPI|nr:hypothetical protein NP493_1263g00002 [Ridgeia piscesae]